MDVVLLIVLMSVSVFLMTLMISPAGIRACVNFGGVCFVQLEHNEFASTACVAREVLTIIAWQGNSHVQFNPKKVSRRAGRDTFATGDRKATCLLRDSARELESFQRQSSPEPPRAMTQH